MNLPLTEQLLEDILVEFPRFRLVPKAGDRLSRVIDRCLRIVTFGMQNRYLSRYHTVIGETLYLSPAWRDMDDRARYILLRHERIHLRQRRRYGALGMAWLYLFPVFPLGLALGRARLEWEAYEETLQATAEVLGLSALDDPMLKTTILCRFTGPDYGWMWPFPRMVARWYDQTTERIRGDSANWTQIRDRRNTQFGENS